MCPECASCNSTVCMWCSLQPSSASSTSLLRSFALLTICEGNNMLKSQCRVFLFMNSSFLWFLGSWEFNDFFLFLVDLKITHHLLLALSYDRHFPMCVG